MPRPGRQGRSRARHVSSDLAALARVENLNAGDVGEPAVRRVANWMLGEQDEGLLYITAVHCGQNEVESDDEDCATGFCTIENSTTPPARRRYRSRQYLMSSSDEIAPRGRGSGSAYSPSIWSLHDLLVIARRPVNACQLPACDGAACCREARRRYSAPSKTGQGGAGARLPVTRNVLPKSRRADR